MSFPIKEKMIMVEERRKIERYPMVGKIEITTNDNREITAHIANISFMGICAYSADRIAALTNIMMKVMFTDSFGREQEVSIDGIVIRVAGVGKVYEMGIRFSHYLSQYNNPVLFRHFSQIAATVSDSDKQSAQNHFI